MWTIYADEKLLYDPRVADRGYAVGDNATLAVELNKAGRFSFTVPAVNPAYSSISKGHTIIELFRGGRSYFRGRVLDSEAGFYNALNVVCESELAYLNDSTQRPYDFPQEEGKSDAVDYLQFLISRHNALVEPYQRFVVGRVTVKDPNAYIHRSDTEYSTTWQLIKEGLLDKLGGFLMVRRESGVNYLDYLAEIDAVSGQSITFGQNLLDLKTKRSKAEVFSVVIPLGAKDEETGERLTLSEIPDEETEDICKQGDTLYSKAAVAEYGRIERVRTFDDVTTTNVLKRRGIESLGEGRAIPRTTKITAADLSGAGYDVEDFFVGYNVKFSSPPHQQAHNLDPSYLVRRMDLKLFDPAKNVLTVGATTSTFLEQNSQQNAGMKDVIIGEIGGIIDDKVDSSAGALTEELQSFTTSAIEKSDSEILAFVKKDYFTKDETAQFVGDEFTKITTDENGVVIDFRQLKKDTAQNGAGIEEINSFIRLEGGNIIIGKDNDTVELVQTNNRLSFIDRGTGLELAYISDGRFFAPRVTVDETLDLGGYRIDTDDGLVFRWIGG